MVVPKKTLTKRVPSKRTVAGKLNHRTKATAKTTPKASRAIVKAKSVQVAARIIQNKMKSIYDLDKWVPGTELQEAATPLDVMIEAMRRAYKIGGPLRAFEYAVAAAPYIHGKINTINLTLPGVVGSDGVVRAVQEGAVTLNSMLVEFVDPPEPDIDDVEDVLAGRK